MNEVEKLRVLLPHWIDHNQDHAQEFKAWAEKVGGVKGELTQAVVLMDEMNEALQSALDELGGPRDGPVHHHPQ